MTAYSIVAALIGLVGAAMILASQRRINAVVLCDDCPGVHGCLCADGRTDTTDCTCGTPGGDS